jgi:hypothetical protein
MGSTNEQECGVRLFLASTQLPKLFGLHGAHGDFWENSRHFLAHLQVGGQSDAGDKIAPQPKPVWSDLNALLPLALACFLLAAVETAAIGRTFNAKHGGRLDANQALFSVSRFLSVTALSMSSPCNATASVVGTISIFGVCLMRSTSPSPPPPRHAIDGAVVASSRAHGQTARARVDLMGANEECEDSDRQRNPLFGNRKTTAPLVRNSL